jgi:hypothetical protein
VALTDPFLPPGQWAFVHDLAKCADGTAAGAVGLARRAGLTGLLVKVLDGASPYPGGGAAELLAACRAAGVGCSGWGYVYPGDGAATAALIQQWLQLSGNEAFLVDAEVEFEVPDGAQQAQALLAAVRQVCRRPWYTSLPWPDQQAAFPWTAFQAACAAFAPQVYGSALAGAAGPVSDAWMDTCWNRASIGPGAGGPAYTTGGPAGWQGLSPVLPVVPIFDLANISRAAYLARNGGFSAIIWWLLDGLTAAQADALAQTPYAAQAAAPAAAPAAPQPVPTPDVAAARQALGQAQAALANAQAALSVATAALGR